VTAAGVNGTDPVTLAAAQSAFAAGMAPAAVQMQHPVPVGTPHTPEIREVRPVEELGMGYHEAPDGTPR
jgi:hypothetical protein